MDTRSKIRCAGAATVAALTCLTLACDGGGSPTAPAGGEQEAQATTVLPDPQPPGHITGCPDAAFPLMTSSGPRWAAFGAELTEAECDTTIHGNRRVMVVSAVLSAELVPEHNVNFTYDDTGLPCPVPGSPPITDAVLESEDYRLRMTHQGELKGRCTWRS